MTCQNWS